MNTPSRAPRLSEVLAEEPLKIRSGDLSPSTMRRWALGTGAFAGTGAAVGAMAATVQIDLDNNLISTSSNWIETDLTDDGVTDLPGLFGSVISTAFYLSESSFAYSYRVHLRSNIGTFTVSSTVFNLYKWFGRAFWYSSSRFLSGSQYSGSGYFASAARSTNMTNPYFVENFGTTPQQARSLVPVEFQDARINGGQSTNGFVEVFAFNNSPTDQVVQMVRLVFNDSGTAAPAGVVPGGSDTAWVAPATPTPTPTVSPEIVDNTLLTKLKKDVKKAKKKLKKAKRTGQKAKAKKLKKKIKKLKQKLKALG